MADIEAIKVQYGSPAKDQKTILTQSVIVVPDRALDEPGFIKTYSTTSGQMSKHDLHQLSQIALFDFEDGNLIPENLSGQDSLAVDFQNSITRIPDGIVLARLESGAPALLVCEGAEVMRLLKLAHRFCTRWIRLDVR